MKWNRWICPNQEGFLWRNTNSKWNNAWDSTLGDTPIDRISSLEILRRIVETSRSRIATIEESLRNIEEWTRERSCSDGKHHSWTSIRIVRHPSLLVVLSHRHSPIVSDVPPERSLQLWPPLKELHRKLSFTSDNEKWILLQHRRTKIRQWRRRENSFTPLSLSF